MEVRRRNEKEELRAAMWVQGNFFFARSGSVRATFILHEVHLKSKSSGATRARSLCFIMFWCLYWKVEGAAHKGFLPSLSSTVFAVFFVAAAVIVFL